MRVASRPFAVLLVQFLFKIEEPCFDVDPQSLVYPWKEFCNRHTEHNLIAHGDEKLRQCC